VVDRGGLENRCTLAGTQGSNPCLSATFILNKEQTTEINTFQWFFVFKNNSEKPIILVTKNAHILYLRKVRELGRLITVLKHIASNLLVRYT
jgi:hypothetical protein